VQHIQQMHRETQKYALTFEKVTLLIYIRVQESRQTVMKKLNEG